MKIFFLIFAAFVSCTQITRITNESNRDFFAIARKKQAIAKQRETIQLKAQAMQAFKKAKCPIDFVNLVLLNPQSIFKKQTVDALERLKFQTCYNVLHPFKAAFNLKTYPVFANCNFSEREFEEFKNITRDRTDVKRAYILCRQDLVGRDYVKAMTFRKIMLLRILEHFQSFALDTLSISVEDLEADDSLIEPMFTLAWRLKVKAMDYKFRLLTHDRLPNPEKFTDGIHYHMHRLKRLDRPVRSFDEKQDGYLCVDSCGISHESLGHIKQLDQISLLVTSDRIDSILTFLSFNVTSLVSLHLYYDPEFIPDDEMIDEIIMAVLKHRKSLREFGLFPNKFEKVGVTTMHPSWSLILDLIVKHTHSLDNLIAWDVSGIFLKRCIMLTRLEFTYDPALHSRYHLNKLVNLQHLEVRIGLFSSDQVKGIIVNLFKSLPPKLSSLNIHLKVKHYPSRLGEWGTTWLSLPSVFFKAVIKHASPDMTINGIQVSSLPKSVDLPEFSNLLKTFEEFFEDEAVAVISPNLF